MLWVESNTIFIILLKLLQFWLLGVFWWIPVFDILYHFMQCVCACVHVSYHHVTYLL